MYAMRQIARYWLLFWSIAGSMVWANAAADIGEIRAIEFQIASDNLEQFGFSLSPADLADRVRTNLAEWDYPLPVNGPYSHTLKARIGQIEHSDTPVGFSFSSGNSDPRAMDFQKAEVLPIECVFSKDKNTIAENRSTFSARPLASEHGQTRVTEKLVDLISTACFNLLDDLPHPNSQPRASTSSFKPKWMPDVRVEVQETPVKPVAPLGMQKIDSEDQPNPEVKKQIIIHNQGTPVIFEFGHQRR